MHIAQRAASFANVLLAALFLVHLLTVGLGRRYFPFIVYVECSVFPLNWFWRRCPFSRPRISARTSVESCSSSFSNTRNLWVSKVCKSGYSFGLRIKDKRNGLPEAPVGFDGDSPSAVRRHSVIVNSPRPRFFVSSVTCVMRTDA